jgi:hypothetical protein
VRVIQRPRSRVGATLRCHRVDHHLMVGERGRGVLVLWREQHCVPPTKALGEGSRGCEFADPDLAVEATEPVRSGACILRSPTK